VFVFVATALVAPAVALLLSRRRRRTVIQLAVAGSVGVVLLRRVVFRLREDVADLPPREQGRGVARAAMDQFLDPLLLATALLLAVLLAAAAVALITGPYPWAMRLRARVQSFAEAIVGAASKGREEATLVWVRGHIDGLQIAGAVVGVLALWVLDISWLGVLLVVLLIGIYEIALLRMRADEEATPPAPPAEVAGT
jgi:hypothetical protein